MRRSWNIARRVDVRSACVDIVHSRRQVYLLSTHADRQVVDISFTIFCLFVCTVTDFSAENKGGVKFCTAVHRRPRQGISYFGELCWLHGVPITFERRVDVGLACVDIRQSAKTDVLVFCVCTVAYFFSPRIKLVASNFAWRFIGVQKGMKSHILGNFASPEAHNRPANRPARALNYK